MLVAPVPPAYPRARRSRVPAAAAVGAGCHFEQVPIEIVEIEAATTIVVVHPRLLALGIGPIMQAPLAEPVMQSAETRVIDEERVMLRNGRMVDIHVVEVDAIIGGDHSEWAPSARRPQSKHFSQKQGRAVRVSRRQDRVVELDIHQRSPILKLIRAAPIRLSVAATTSRAMSAVPATM